jgi:excisionase family DNA binding protein
MSTNFQEQDYSFRISKLLKADEVAQILGVSRSYAFLLMRRGDIATVRIGRSVRVRPQDLEGYISQNLSSSEESFADQT